MTMYRRHNVFHIGDIVEIIPDLPRESKEVEQRRKCVRGKGPYKLLILQQVDKATYLVAICKKKKKNTQMCLKTTSGCLYISLSEFLLIDKNALLFSSGNQLEGNKQARVRLVFKARDAFRKSGGKDFFLDLSNPAKSEKQETLQLQNQHTQEISNVNHDGDDIDSTQEHILLYQLPVLESNNTKCPYCMRDFNGMTNIMYGYGKNSIRYTTARVCTLCKIIILDQNQLDQLQHQIGANNVHTISAQKYKTSIELMKAVNESPPTQNDAQNAKPLPFNSELSIPLNLSETDRKVTIFSQKCHCTSCFIKYGRHTILSRTAKVRTALGQLVDVNVMFCAGCGHYYMSYESFKQYKKLYGRLLFECELSSELQNSQAAFINFAPDSLLSRWGYNVKKDTPKEQRQAILQFLLETKRISKFGAIEMIKGFIALKEKQPQYRDACERWREDILFINNYRIKEQDAVYGLTFEQGGKIRK